MSDETLVASAIKQEATEHNLILPFNPDRLKGASYDISAGDMVIVAYSERQGGIQYTKLGLAGSVIVPPGHKAIVYSLERLNLPDDMKGRLSPRAALATRLVFFAGGIIDPGYKGHLFLPLANLGDTPFEIRAGEPIATAEFIRLGERTFPYAEGTEQLDITRDRLPTPAVENVYDPAALSGKLDFLESRLAALEPSINLSRTVSEFVLLGALAGAVAGISVSLLTAKESQVSGLALASALLALFLVLLIRRARQSSRA